MRATMQTVDQRFSSVATDNYNYKFNPNFGFTGSVLDSLQEHNNNNADQTNETSKRKSSTIKKGRKGEKASKL
jgi:hypothetical protein